MTLDHYELEVNDQLITYEFVSRGPKGDMKNTDKTTKDKTPAIRINKALNKYDNIVLFPEKVQQAKEDFAKYGMPNISKKKC